MRAWILDKQEPVEARPLKLVQLPTPHPNEGEIRLKTLVCGVCRTDIHIAEGNFAWALRHNRSVLFPASHFPEKRLVFHSLTTKSNIIGIKFMFIYLNWSVGL